MEIRTPDLLRPRQARYQAALRPDIVGFYSNLLSEVVATARETILDLLRGIVELFLCLLVGRGWFDRRRLPSSEWLVTAGAFVGTNPMDESIASDSPLIRPEFSSAVQRDSELLGWALAKINLGLDRQ